MLTFAPRATDVGASRFDRFLSPAIRLDCKHLEVCVNGQMVGGHAGEIRPRHLKVSELESAAKEQTVEGTQRKRAGKCIGQRSCTLEAYRDEVLGAEASPEIIEIATDNDGG